MSEMTYAHDGLPTQITPFVGRQKELAELRQMLGTPGCRLLTLVGPGGVGKTRLAIEAARQAQIFADGVAFIDLQPILSDEQVLSAIANHFGQPLNGREDPLLQLSAALQGKNTLLLLDNFEHLTGAAWQIGALLQNTTTVKFLITSREALNLLGECHYPVSGMPVTGGEDGLNTVHSDAVELFAACARRARPDFALEAERDGVLEICRLVDGFPLAIELAASWARMMPCADIAQEIHHNTQFLATSAHNVPERHRSVQAIFRQTFERLSQAEQDALRRLAVFQGGFRREAAHSVAGASLAVLSELVDKSLLKWSSGGRYQIHELLRQCSEEELKRALVNGAPEMLESARELHSAYYTKMLRAYEPRLLHAAQADVLAGLIEEEQNFTRAWQWAAENGRFDEVFATINTLELFYQYQSRFLEGTLIVEKVTRLLEEHPPTPAMQQALAAVLNSLSWFVIRLGDYPRAQRAAERSLALFTQTGAYPLPGIATHPLTTLSVLEQIAGRYDDAARLAREVIQIASTRGDMLNLAVGHYTLAGSLLPAGETEEAYTQAQMAYQQAKTQNLPWFMSYCLIEQGEAAQALGRGDEACLHYEACYAIRDALEDPEGMAVALNHLGAVALTMGDTAQAQRNYRQSLAIYEKIKDPGGLVTALNGLSACSVGAQKFAEAQVFARDALRAATEMRYVTVIHSILVNAAEIFLQTGREQLAVSLLRFIERQPGAAQDTRQKARRLLSALNLPALPGENDLSLDAIVLNVLQQLAIPPGIQQGAGARSTEAGAENGIAGPGGDVEPLTGREIEVLHCLADGLSNQEIASQMFLSVGTVKWYTSQIYGKLGVKSRTRAVALARQMRLIPGTA